MINAYGKYRGVRDGAWRCLRDYSVRSLPVDVLKIARDNDIKVIKDCDIHELRENEIGLSYYDGISWFVIYDDSFSVERSRFTLAHELGHILLGHSMVAARQARTQGIDQRSGNEREADMFASRLLCPACVLWGLDLHTADEIADYCKVSLQAARIRSERMKVLYERNMFLVSPLEREVYYNFEEYIRNERKKRGI